MKRLLATLLAIVMLISLAACGSGAKDESPKTTESAAQAKNDAPASAPKTKLKVWMAPQTEGDELDMAFWNKALAGWQEDNNVELEISIIPWGDYEERYMTAFAAGEGPDVGYMYMEMLYEYINNGQLEPMDDYLTDEDRENYTSLHLGQFYGHQYTMPHATGGARVMFCNMDILAAAGVTKAPATWQEFIDACVAVKNANLDGTIPYAAGWGGDSIGILNAAYYPFMWQAGGDLFNGNDVALLDNTGAVDAAQFVYDLVYKYEVLPADTLSYTDSDIETMFKEGKLAFLCSNIKRADTWTEAGINWEMAGPDNVGHLEKEAGTGWATMTAADAFVMNAASEHKDLAWSLIRHLTGAEVMDLFHEEISIGPNMTKDAKNYFNEKQQATYAQVEYIRTLPVAPNSAAVMQQLKSNLQLMLLGELTPQEAISNTVDYTNSMK